MILSIRDTADLYHAYWAAAEALQGAFNMPRVKGALADRLEDEIEALTTKACKVADEVMERKPTTQDEAAAKLEILVDHLGKRCGDYDEAALVATHLLPSISRGSPLPRR